MAIIPKPMRARYLSVWFAILACLSSQAISAQPTCTIAPADKTWLDGAIAHWRIAERDFLKLPPRPLPTFVAVDARCTYVAPPSAGTMRWRAEVHGATVTFPDGKTQPLGPISFAAADQADPAKGYFAMSLPSVWRAAGVTSKLGLERLMDGVMLHEIMHVRQFAFANPALAAITKRYGFGDDLGDDTIQQKFEKNPDYAADYRVERDALFAAAAAPSDAEARKLAAEGLRLMQRRRARWFTGGDARWLEVDDIFLTMEGLGQWLAWRWYTSPRGPHLPAATVLPAVRRGGKYWTQDEGLALFLVVDRLLPGWQALAFAEQPVLADEMLARAAAPPHRRSK